jgi:hypothetical protein
MVKSLSDVSIGCLPSPEAGHDQPNQRVTGSLPSGRKGSHKTIFSLLAVVLLGALSIVSWGLALDPFWWTVIGIGTAVNTLGLLYILRSAGFEWQSGPCAYLSVLWLFHFPLTLLVGLGASLASSVSSYDYILSWLSTSNWYRAAAYANGCAACFVLGCLFVRRRRASVGKVLLRPIPALYYIGMAIAILAASYLAFLFLKSGGRDVFFMSYSSLYDTLFGGEFTLASFLVTIGASIAILARPGNLWVTGGSQRWD